MNGSPASIAARIRDPIPSSHAPASLTFPSAVPHTNMFLEAGGEGLPGGHGGSRELCLGESIDDDVPDETGLLEAIREEC